MVKHIKGFTIYVDDHILHITENACKYMYHVVYTAILVITQLLSIFIHVSVRRLMFETFLHTHCVCLSIHIKCHKYEDGILALDIYRVIMLNCELTECGERYRPVTSVT